MNGFTLQPNVFSTEQHINLQNILERVWISESSLGSGVFYLLSGFGNYNGGVRFYSTFRRHTHSGGQVKAFFGASTSQRLTSRQLIERLLNCNCIVYLINRKRIFHSKCYGTSTNSGDKLVVSSGNFTGPGMTQNVESSVFLDTEITSRINFSWEQLEQSILDQNWEIYQPNLSDPDDPAWNLLYDEHEDRLRIDESQNLTMVLILSHADTARIRATPGSRAGLGSQYFWLSKDSYDFFPPLTIYNERGYKTTHSCLINVFFVDLGEVQRNVRVTFEADNNVDFRLGTGKYRYTNLARKGDLAAISRISEDNYEIRLFRQESPEFSLLSPYAVTFIGNQGKRLGYLNNERFENLLGTKLMTNKEFESLE